MVKHDILLCIMINLNTKCLVCDKEFYASPGHKSQGWGKYCGMSCRTVAKSGENNPNWRGGMVECSCQQCNKKFGVKKSHAKIGEGKFCSVACRRMSNEKTKRVCAYCGKKFEVYQSAVKKRRAIYCSRDCASLHRSKKLTNKCLVCGKEFKIKLSVLNWKKGAGSFCSMNCKARYMSASQITTSGVDRNHIKGGKREDLGFYVRSGWEANYARYLMFLQKHGQIAKWEYEPDTFDFVAIKRGTKFYTPDFKVFHNNGSVEYHEVKGYMDAKSITRHKRMSKYFPDITIVMIDSPVYKRLERRVASLIPNWE